MRSILVSMIFILEGGYYWRAATIGGRLLLEGGYYWRAATTGGRLLLEGNFYFFIVVRFIATLQICNYCVRAGTI